MAQWFMAALVRHPGFESHSCWFFAFLLSLSAGWIPIKRSYTYVRMYVNNMNPDNRLTDISVAN